MEAAGTDVWTAAIVRTKADNRCWVVTEVHGKAKIGWLPISSKCTHMFPKLSCG
jgi:hypothetical protein